MNNTLENAFADLGLGDSDSDDTITPMGEPSVQIGRSSRKHSYDPYGRLSDGEAVHYDTPQPSGRTHMFEDPDSDWEGYLSLDSREYSQRGSEFLSSHKRGVGVGHNGRGVGPAPLQGSHLLYSGVSQESVVRCSTPVKDHDFVPPSENFCDPILQSSYVATIPGRPSTVQNASVAPESNSHFVITPQPLPSASDVLESNTLVFDSQPTQGQQLHSSPPAGPAPQPSGSQHANPRGASLGTVHPDQGDAHVAPRSAQSSDLQAQGSATQTPTTQGHNVAVSSGGTPSAAHLYQTHVNLGNAQTTHYPYAPGCRPEVSQDGTPLCLFIPKASNFGYPAPVVLPQPYYFREEGGGRVAEVQSHLYEPRETQVHFGTPSPQATQQPNDLSPDLTFSVGHRPSSVVWPHLPSLSFSTPTPCAQQQPTKHTLAPVTLGGPSRHTSRSHDRGPPAPRSKLKYKDLRYDGKSSWKAFLHKFVRLSQSQQWTKLEQHDQFCFSLEGLASEYYTLLLEVSPRLRFRDILKKFDKRFGTSAPDLTHQLNFQSASQRGDESLREWADRVLVLATRAFPQLPDIHTHAIPRLCFGAEDVDAGLYALDGNPKTVEEALDRMQFYQHSRRRRPSQHVTARQMAEDDQTVESRREADEESRKMQEWHRRISQLEEAVEEIRTPVKPENSEIQDLWSRVYDLEMALKETTRRSGTPPPSVREEAGLCFQCGEMGHFGRDCPLDARQKSEGSVSGDWDSPLSNRGACPAEDYSRGPQFRSRAASESQLIRTVRMMTPDRSDRTEMPPVDGCTTEQTSRKSGSNPLVVKVRSCTKSRREHSGLEGRFESSPSPDLFSNEEPEAPGSRVSAPVDWSAEPKVRPSEELAVESGCPEVMDDNGEDSMGVVKCGGCGEAESEIRELRGKVQLLEKTLKEVLDSTRLGTQMTGLPRRHPGPRTSNCFKCGKSGHFRRECRTYVRRTTDGGAGDDCPLPYRGARRAVADTKTQMGSSQPMESGQLRTVCRLTRDKMNSLRKPPAGDPCVDQDTSGAVIGCRRKRGRRRVRRKRLKAAVLGNGEVTPTDRNPGRQMQRSKEIPTESRCPEAMVDLVDDSVPQNQGAVSRDEDLYVQAATTVKPRIMESSPEVAKEYFKIPAGGQHQGEATNSEYPSPGVLIEVMDVPPRPSLPSELRTACLVDQT